MGGRVAEKEKRERRKIRKERKGKKRKEKKPGNWKVLLDLTSQQQEYKLSSLKKKKK